jgi:carbamoyl-phosphate synthase large subunit
MKEITVLVTGVGGGGHGEQIVKALRLAENDYRIVGADMSPFSKGLLDVDQGYLIPPANDGSYTQVLLKICARHDVAAVFHGSEPELKVMSRDRDMIQERGLFLPINPAAVIELCMDKIKTCDFLVERGFHVSSYAAIKSVEDLKTSRPLPAVQASVGGGGSANILLAQTRDELLTFGQHMLSLYSEFIVQEYIGTPDSEFTVGVLISMDGELLNSIAVKRAILSSLSNRVKVGNRTGRDELGPVLALSSGISQGEIGTFPEVTAPCEEIALALGCRGAVNIQCRYVNGKVYVFEINPRFSGTTSLRAMVGYNEPDVLIRRHLLNERITPHFAYGSGVIMRGLSESLIKSQSFPLAQEL